MNEPYFIVPDFAGPKANCKKFYIYKTQYLQNTFIGSNTSDINHAASRKDAFEEGVEKMFKERRHSVKEGWYKNMKR